MTAAIIFLIAQLGVPGSVEQTTLMQQAYFGGSASYEVPAAGLTEHWDATTGWSTNLGSDPDAYLNVSGVADSGDYWTFDGVGNEYFQIRNYTMPSNLRGPLTFFVCFKDIDTEAGSGWGTIYGNDYANNWWTIYTYGTDPAGYFKIKVYPGTQIYAGYEVGGGEYTSVVLVNPAGSNNCRLFINGELVGTGLADWFYMNSGSYMVGRGQNGTYNSTGKYASFGTYANTALSDEDAEALGKALLQIED